MSNMASSKGIGLSFIMLMIIVMVNGRWLEVDNLSTSMISDGLHDQALENPPNLHMVVSNSSESTITLYAEKRCQSIYGFLPCGDTIQEGVFLMLMYTYLMMLGEEWIHKGSEALFVLLGDKAIGASVFRVLMALPRIVIVIVSGVLATASDAQNQVAFGVGMYAGSTVITLTLIWGFRIILSRDKLRGKESTPECEHQQDSTTKCFSFNQILSVLNDTGVNIDDETGSLAVIMLLSMIPFATVQLATLMKIPGSILLALIVSSASLLLCFAHQLWNPWIQARSLAYLKQEHLRARFFYHVQRLAEDDLIDEHGKPNLKAFESIFTRADTDNDGHISEAESKVEVKPVIKAEVKPVEEKTEELQPKYAKLESLYPATRPQVVEPVPEVKPAAEPQRQIQKLHEFDLLKVIERNLQKFVSSISTLVGHLNIPAKITQLVEVCQKHLKVCQDKAGEIGQGLNNFAKQTTDDFLSEFALLKTEVKKLSQEVAKEVRNKADEQKERKENGQIYFPPLLLFSTSEPKPVESVVQSEVAPQPEVAPANDDLSESELAELIEHFEIEKSEQVEEKQPQITLTEQQKADLAVLEGMGFGNDHTKLLPVLVKHQGNLVAVVEELLSM